MIVSNFLKQVDSFVSNPPFSSEEILNFARLNLASVFYPKLRTDNDGYFTHKATVNTVKDNELVRLPRLAFNASLVEVKLKMGDNLINLTKVNPSQINDSRKGVPCWFYHIRDKLALWPIPQDVYTIELWYELSPPKLVNESTGRKIIAKVSSDTVRVESKSETFEPDLYDLINSNSTEAEEVGFTAVRNGSEYTSSKFEYAEVGDYLFKNRETGFIPLPEAYELALLNLVAGNILEGMGDVQEGKLKLERGISLMNEVSNVPTRTVEENVLFSNEWY